MVDGGRVDRPVVLRKLPELHRVVTHWWQAVAARLPGQQNLAGLNVFLRHHGTAGGLGTSCRDTQKETLRCWMRESKDSGDWKWMFSVEEYKDGWRKLKENILFLLAHICMGYVAQTRGGKSCDSDEWKVAEEWKLQSKQSTTCPEGSRWTDSLSQLHQSASDKHPQGTNTPLENTSADWTVNWKWTECREGSLQLSVQVVSLRRSHTPVSACRIMHTTVTVLPVCYYYTLQCST